MPLDTETVLAFAPATNEKRADATGAFHPEAHKVIDHARGGELVLIDNRRPFPARRALVLDAMRRRAGSGFPRSRFSAMAGVTEFSSASV